VDKGGCCRGFSEQYFWLFLVLSLVIPVAVAAADNSAIVGVWKGKMDSLPMLTLTVEEETES